MNRKSYALINVIVTALMVFAVGYAVNQSEPYLGLISVLIGIAALSFAKRNLDEVLEDERIVRISEKASRRAFDISAIALALLGMVLIAMNKAIGYILDFAVCCMLILYLAFYALYSRGEIS